MISQSNIRRDLHPDLRADTAMRMSANPQPRSHSAGLLRSERQLLANPPFNDSDWFRKDDDVRWQFGVPPKGNANFAHGSMSSSQPGEGATQRNHIKADWEISSDEMRTTNGVFPTSTFETHPSNFASLPGQLFYSTQIPVCLWFLAKNKNADAKRGFRDRRRQILVSRAEPAFTNFSNN